ncbi:Holliday junction resolvase RuvX [Mycoplasma nasistruthionis]|uniref:Putative pre-16S rRNA nuclease n=1 Tax=Mycoplasma nasistruthionis TaxID=353852 RepID=A0A4Y6I628_9MOLU|nr:Holliday junction resolvase RuvX [Mycoplasma nasistruthionis]QDF65085.1 Holliday junction resolvase RuvX [Mycoplasma nasistruthionis]
MRKLALDLGSKSCGFAITDYFEIIPSGLENFIYNEGQFNEVLNRIEYYLNQYKNEIDGLVIGYPLKISGEKSQTTLMVESFIELIKTKFNLPIVLINEQYSTKRAQETLMSAGLNNKKRKQFKDKLAAVFILQDYLDYYKK